jgi:hypothetical protein
MRKARAAAAAPRTSEESMKQQRFNVYARFVSDETQSSETGRVGVAKARRTAVRATQGGPQSPKQGLKKHPVLPK